MASPTTTGSNNSLLAGLTSTDNIHLIIGTNPLAAARCTQSLAAGARPVLIAPALSELHYALQSSIDQGLVKWEQKVFDEADLFRLGRDEVDRVVDAVFVTSGPRDEQSILISTLCKRNRIPVNVVDAPSLCTFTLLSTHTDGPLQIGVTTNGRGCKLASRIRREIASSLPPNLGAACSRFGEARRRIQEADAHSTGIPTSVGDLDDSVGQGALFNRLVAEGDSKGRRMRWLSQVCEYWPLKKLASVADEDVEKLLSAYTSSPVTTTTLATATTPATASHPTKPPQTPKKLGRIILAGSGPGHPSLLTRATHQAILSADLILADKLVPSGVLDLIPRRTQVSIARKFPGNADAAQEELQTSALSAAFEGKTVLRLKQGDPFIYGRGGEEVESFRKAGLPSDRIVVLPGITSALSAPLFAGVPATQRDVADQLLICTGTGKKGKPPAPPEFVPSRTVVFLMALHRINGLVKELTTRLDIPDIPSPSIDSTTTTPQPLDTTPRPPSPTMPTLPSSSEAKRTLYPLNTPCAVIERASCPDQRVIRTTLAHVAEAIEAEGSRPPGLLVVGAACEALYTKDRSRAWVVEEGFRGMDIEEPEWAATLDGVMRLGES